MSAAAPPVPLHAQNASLTDWIAVLAGALGSLMATLDVSIVNSSLPTIQGEIGASGTEGTWVATAFLVAEIVIIPLSGWFERMLGLRTFMIASTIFFIFFSVICGISHDLVTMVIGRVGQGLAGGALIPTAMVIVATRLPPHQQPIGTALFGMTAVLGPVVGPLLGGWLTENWSWHYAFFINVPVSLLLITLMLLGLPHNKADFEQLFHADWFGIIGMSLGLGAMTVVLEEGQREQWFDSRLIIRLTIAAIIGFVLMTIGQFRAKKPVIRLSLMFDRQFGAVVILATVLGAVLYGTSYVIPQFLATVAGYNAQQAGYIVAISGIPTLSLMPFTPIFMRHIDTRVAVTFGMCVMALSCWIDSGLTADSRGGDFVISQLLRGGGQIFVFLFLNQTAIRSVSRELAVDASGLFNAARNIGGSMGIALLGTIQDQRDWFHSRRLEEALPANAIAVQDYLAGLIHSFGDPARAFQVLNLTLQREALVMTYNDMFWLLAVGVLCVCPLIMLLRPLPQHAPPVAVH